MFSTSKNSQLKPVRIFAHHFPGDMPLEGEVTVIPVLTDKNGDKRLDLVSAHTKHSDKNGFCDFFLEEGNEIVVRFNKKSYQSTQTAIITVPNGGILNLNPFKNVVLQVSHNLVISLFALFMGKGVQPHGKGHGLAIIVTPQGKTLEHCPQGIKEATVEVSPTPKNNKPIYYFSAFESKLSGPLIYRTNVLSRFLSSLLTSHLPKWMSAKLRFLIAEEPKTVTLDGGVFVHCEDEVIPPSGKFYTVSAKHPTKTFNTRSVIVSENVLTVACPPYGLEANEPDHDAPLLPEEHDMADIFKQSMAVGFTAANITYQKTKNLMLASIAFLPAVICSAIYLIDKAHKNPTLKNEALTPKQAATLNVLSLTIALAAYYKTGSFSNAVSAFALTKTFLPRYYKQHGFFKPVENQTVALTQTLPSHQLCALQRLALT
ncbi:MAG: hypothetical protein ABI597_05025 [Gammaproteobacteria bacterium]